MGLSPLPSPIRDTLVHCRAALSSSARARSAISANGDLADRSRAAVSGRGDFRRPAPPRPPTEARRGRAVVPRGLQSGVIDLGLK